MKKTNKRISGTSFYYSTVIATVDQLIQVLGEPTDDLNTGQDKVNFEWEMELESGDVFTVYDYKEYRMIARDQMIEWHIGGFDVYVTNQAAREINRALLASRDNSALELVEKQIKQLATEIVGDGKSPNKFFVTSGPYYFEVDEYGDREAVLLDGFTDNHVETTIFDTLEDAEKYYNDIELDIYDGVGQVMIEDRMTGAIKEKTLEKVVRVEYSMIEVDDTKLFGYK